MVCLFLALIVGCGEAGPEFAKVEGIVRVEGKPQPGLMVRFMPDPSKGTELAVNSMGETDKTGHYELRYYHKDGEGIGAPVGWHRVTLEDTSLSSLPQGAAMPPMIVPSEYNNPAKTPISKQVVSGPQTIDLEVNP